MLNDDIRGRMLAQIFWSELEKIANLEDQQSTEENKNLNQMKFKEVEKDLEEEDEDDKDSIIGTSFLKKEKEKYKAKSVPILKDRSSEGLRFDPNMQSYVPDFDIKAQEISDTAKKQGILEGKKQGLTETLNTIRKNKQQQGVLQEKQNEAQQLRTKLDTLRSKKQEASQLRQQLEQVRAQKQQQLNQA